MGGWKVRGIVGCCLAAGFVFAGPPVHQDQEEAPEAGKLRRTLREARLRAFKRSGDGRGAAMDVLLAQVDELRGTGQIAGMMLRDGDDEVRFKAAQILIRMGPIAGEYAAQLMKAIENEPIGTVRAQQTWALPWIFSGMNPQGQKAAVALLIRLMQKDDEHGVRVNACRAFRLIGRRGKEAAPALLEIATAKEDSGLREWACHSLMDVVGPETKAIVPDLLKAYKEAELTEVKGTILTALGIVGDKEEVVIPLLIEALKDKKQPGIRVGAAVGLEGFGPRAKAAVPDLIEALAAKDLKDKDLIVSVRCAALQALGSIGPDARSAIPAIVEASRDPHPMVQQDAARAMTLIEKK